ncbi:heme ABC exporter ATP-binding protein CcmA [Deinococcus maricopensis]|uniref:Heme exporter protein CcmA n=1 Tax=Deinococcus maricopensis (strain DSM 21211 / LMG 22137 / NRRL B-23946 / LB-34) TaxID=709986 RepID=E8U6W7_DEIML|nr:heme ABC exporter ATP-binding protein CcmA [Deinococcus maricopensis]ADV66806.1 heme exporter protein CcmA [Deinococcus maricopensis DSM 21211]
MAAAVTPDPYAVQLRGVSLRLGQDAVLRGVDLDLARGEAVTLLGANGAGKTTLLRVLAGALGVSRGDGRVFGFALSDRRSLREHTHLMAFDGAGLYPDLTCRENLAFTLRMYGLSGDVDGALARVDLTRAADRRARFLSAGMRKRLALARALLAGRPLTLVDEPFANLDDDGRAVALDVLRDLHGRGVTLVVAAHEPELARAVAARALRLQGGALTEAP